MEPGDIYFLCLALIVMPLLPFSRTAAVVGLVWLFGQAAFLVGIDPRAFDIVGPILACGAAWFAAANDRDQAIGILYLPTAVIWLSNAAGATHPYDAWWLDWYFAMARVLLLPFTVNFEAVREVYRAFKQSRDWDDIIWKRVLCWQ